MKKIICLALLVVVVAGVFLVNSSSFAGQAEAASKNSEIVGTWIRSANDSSLSTVYQFDKAGNFIYFTDTHSRISDNSVFYYSYNYDGSNKLEIGGNKYTVSLVENGLAVWFAVSSTGSIYELDAPLLFVRA